jgi:hypothetical protein
MKTLPQHEGIVRALYAETDALVAEGWTTADQLFRSLQAADLSNEARMDLERRFNAHMDKLEREIGQLNSLLGIVNALDGSSPGPAQE